MSIEVVKVTKWFGSHRALHDVSLTVESGGLVALLGPSGSGKTTLLRILAGLEQPDSGTVAFHGGDVSQAGVRERGVGFVFQHYALFRHMTTFENIAFGMRVQPRSRRPSEAQIRARVEELLHLIQLQGFARHYPPQLSGGQRQRVALARALAIAPKVLLLDEPFGSLDAKVRQELRRWLRKLHDEMHVTSVLVTHDQDEALEVADRVVVMNEGVIEQEGTPSELYERPATPFVAEFLGEVNVFEGVATGGRIDIGALRFSANGFADGTRVRLTIRTVEVAMWRDEPGVATVTRVADLGDRLKVEATIDGAGSIVAQLARHNGSREPIERGCRVGIDASRSRVYPVRAKRA